MATPFNSYPFCNGITASWKLCNYEYSLINVLFVKIKEMSVDKLLLRPIFVIFCGKYIAAF